MKNIEVVAAVIRKDDLIFATQRGYGEFIGGWEFPGGKIEENEDKQDALKREIKEELDANIEVGDFIGTFHHQYDSFYLTMHCYFCKFVDNNIFLKEHLASKWLKKSELENVDWLEADIAVVEEIKKLI